MVLGPIENNVYIIDDGKAAMVVDPSCQVGRILEALDGRVVDTIVLTHFHWDHVGAAAELREKTGARVVASAIDAPYITGERSYGPAPTRVKPCPVDELVGDGDEVQVGGMTWKVLLTPGHSQGSICLFLDPQYGSNTQGAPVLVSGDTLFCGTHGRTDFDGGDPAAMLTSLTRLAELPPDTIVLPGHNATTVMAREATWIQRGRVVR